MLVVAGKVGLLMVGRSSVVVMMVAACAVLSSGCDESEAPSAALAELADADLTDEEFAIAEAIAQEMVYDEDLGDFVAISDYDKGILSDYLQGRDLFMEETFDGNGRTCVTCHSRTTGKITPSEIETLWGEDPSAPIFRSIDSDDGVGSSYERLREHGTVRVGITLPDNVSLVDDPAQQSIVVLRGIPTTLDTPALDPVLMYDGRQPDLESQANGAIHDHAQPNQEPTSEELGLIASFQRTFSFFSSWRTFIYAKGGPAPKLPKGKSEAEKRGRKWFVPSPEGLCSHCHGGPMLNETNEFFLGPVPQGSRFLSVAVSEFNRLDNPVYSFAFDNPEDPENPIIVDSPDPGRALITGDIADLNAFKIPSLWGLNERGGPFFHDHSAKTLEEVTDHYADYFALPPANLVLSEQDKEDITAYMKLL